MQVALPRCWPQSAVAAEIFASAVVSEALARGSRQGGALGKGSVVVVSDRQAAVNTFRRRDRWLSPTFVYAACWMEGGLEVVGSLRKVSAHKGRDVAENEGWLDDWVGNDLADFLARDALPHVLGHPEAWVRAARGRCKKAAAVLAGVGGPAWRQVHLLPRLGPLARAARRRKRVDVHVPVFGGGRWACKVCGRAFRNVRAANSASGVVCPGFMRLCKIRTRRTHSSGAPPHRGVGVRGGPP